MVDLLEKKVLSVIPARGGSKGIPKKNCRVLNEKPLIYYAINLSKQSSFVDRTVLTTDDIEIARIGEYYGVDKVIMRPSKLSEDSVPLAPVIRHAIEEQEENFEFVLSFQPTTPLISLESLNAGIKKGIDNDSDSVIFVTDATAHYWKEGEDQMELLSTARENRQYMENIFEEIGIFLTRSDLIEEEERIGDNPSFKRVSKREGVDIDDYGDWILAENYMKRKLLVYRVVGNSDTGLGHVSRGLTIAKQVHEHDLLFAVNSEDDLAKQILQKNNFPFFEFENEKEFNEIIENREPDVLINDMLDTSLEYMDEVKNKVEKVINFEDMGEGSEIADAVINALYEFSTPPENHFYGHKYVCLRDEFRYIEEKNKIPEVNRIMISYGGVDESNMTQKALESILEILDENDFQISIDIVLGLGYEHIDKLESQIQSVSREIDIELNQDVSRMSDHMRKADLLLTSNGRTIYEAASMNLPIISVSQNQRETKHLFSHICKGVWNLGLADFTTKENLKKAILEYIENDDKREGMIKALDSYDIKNGVKRVKGLILEDKEG